VERSAEYRQAVNVPSINSQTASLGVDVHFAEKLQAAERRETRRTISRDVMRDELSNRPYDDVDPSADAWRRDGLRRPAETAALLLAVGRDDDCVDHVDDAVRRLDVGFDDGRVVDHDRLAAGLDIERGATERLRALHLDHLR
jgi:hypothetical protein